MDNTIHGPCRACTTPAGLALSLLLLASAGACSTEDDPSADGTGGAVTSSGGADTTPGGSGGGSGGSSGSGGSGAISSGGGHVQGSGGSAGAGGHGTAGVGGSDGEDGDEAFRPCPTAGPCRILPLGDSITEGMVGSTGGGVQFNGGYRVELFSRAIQADKNITFVGSRSNGPDTVDGQPFPKNNEGYSGYTIQQIIDLEGKLASEPHIVLLHIGTNDMIGGAPSSAPERLEILIDQITTALPESLVVVSNIIPLPFASANVSAYNAAVLSLVEARIQGGVHLLFVDQFSGFPTDELPDSVHPNAAGYARMGSVWFDAIEPYLP